MHTHIYRLLWLLNRKEKNNNKEVEQRNPCSRSLSRSLLHSIA